MFFKQIFPWFWGTVVTMSALCANAQSVAPTVTQSSKPAVVISPRIANGAPTWAQLSPSQKVALEPLAQTWDSLSEAHRRKWVVLAENYANMPESEQTVLRSRMVEWAGLKPHEREQARLNFAQSKKVPAADRSANWEAYQALSPEDKKKFATAGQIKPAGAAVAVKPVPPEKLASAPVIRNAPDARKAMSEGSQNINRNTLLPVAEKKAPEGVTPSPAAN